MTLRTFSSVETTVDVAAASVTTKVVFADDAKYWSKSNFAWAVEEAGGLVAHGGGVPVEAEGFQLGEVFGCGCVVEPEPEADFCDGYDCWGSAVSSCEISQFSHCRYGPVSWSAGLHEFTCPCCGSQSRQFSREYRILH
jgi:hypothetical protein